MSEPREIHLSGGKYTVKNDNGLLTATRNGEPWPAADRSLVGDNLSLAMVHRIEELEDRIERARNCLVCVAIADAVEVAENTLTILEEPHE